MLELRNLTCRYGDVTAVSDLSLTVETGELFGLIGANGAGKSTTLMAIAGLVTAASGSIVIGSENITHVPAEQRGTHGIALVPEGRRVFSDLSVDENLTVGGTRLSSGDLDISRQRIFKIFPRLAERRSQLAGSLSGGEQQMLAIGRALMARPSILLIDELSLGLMPKMVDECYEVLISLKSDGLTIVLVEQNTERVLQVADRVAVLESGNLSWTGTGADAIGKSRVVNAYLGIGETSPLQEP